jgi:K+ transporter
MDLWHFFLQFQELSCCRSIVLALQTLGVVFGDVGTSPLYTFDIMFNKYPVTKKEDVLGALSLVLYTLILIPLVKYVLIVLWGNDDGEGKLFCMPIYCHSSIIPAHYSAVYLIIQSITLITDLFDPHDYEYRACQIKKKKCAYTFSITMNTEVVKLF